MEQISSSEAQTTAIGSELGRTLRPGDVVLLSGPLGAGKTAFVRGLAEGLGLAAALGYDLNMIREVFSQTGANSRVLETDGADMVAREHDCWFSAEHAAKDSGIAAGMAQGVGLNLPLNNATVAQYRKMVELGLGGLDKSGIAELTFKGRHA